MPAVRSEARKSSAIRCSAASWVSLDMLFVQHQSRQRPASARPISTRLRSASVAVGTGRRRLRLRAANAQDATRLPSATLRSGGRPCATGGDADIAATVMLSNNRTFWKVRTSGAPPQRIRRCAAIPRRNREILPVLGLRLPLMISNRWTCRAVRARIDPITSPWPHAERERRATPAARRRFPAATRPCSSRGRVHLDAAPFTERLPLPYVEHHADHHACGARSTTSGSIEPVDQDIESFDAEPRRAPNS